MSDGLPFTGERFVPGVAGVIWYEHWHRYHFAAPMVAQRDVLDIACGAGYGSALLARSAKHVTGADLSQDAIDHARSRYASIPNVEFRQADCAALPFADASFDAVVSFETIEHIAAQETFLDEARRVLRPGGLLVLSCPNKVEYTDNRGVVNEFHVRELYRDELAALLSPRFAHVAWYGQRPGFYSVVWPESPAQRGEIFELGEATADTSTQGHARPLYFIVTASAMAATLAGIAPTLSVLADRDEWVYRDYEKVTRNLDAAHRRGNALEGQVGEWQRHHAEAVAQRDALTAAALELRQQHAADLARARDEIARRSGLRWWLTLPLRRLLRALTGKPPA
jgi:ubiquinone/menaquinone biosynthesis C-methylase UbiE